MGQKVVVFGSFVVDLMARTPHLPVPGETVKGSIFKMGPGGKGFNQGVAAHKAGADVTMITKLGRDSFANVALDAMKELGMDTGKILYHDTVETGCALIMVDENSSQNEIVVISGACDTIDDQDLASCEEEIKSAAYLLTQLETNVDATAKAIDLAWQSGGKVVLNTAPVQPVSDEMLSKVYLITPNEVEAETLTGIPVDGEENAKKAAQWFFARGVQNVMITLGSRGVFVSSGGESKILPVPKVKVLDTTGAGDAFNGGLVAALSEGKSLWEAAEFANALASVAVQRMGTTPAMPTRAEIDAFLEQHMR